MIPVKLTGNNLLLYNIPKMHSSSFYDKLTIETLMVIKKLKLYLSVYNKIVKITTAVAAKEN